MGGLIDDEGEVPWLGNQWSPRATDFGSDEQKLSVQDFGVNDCEKRGATTATKPDAATLGSKVGLGACEKG